MFRTRYETLGQADIQQEEPEMTEMSTTTTKETVTGSTTGQRPVQLQAPSASNTYEMDAPQGQVTAMHCNDARISKIYQAIRDEHEGIRLG
jgi:hypothetical protein